MRRRWKRFHVCAVEWTDGCIIEHFPKWIVERDVHGIRLPTVGKFFAGEDNAITSNAGLNVAFGAIVRAVVKFRGDEGTSILEKSPLQVFGVFSRVCRQIELGANLIQTSDAQKLWDKIQRDKKKDKSDEGSVVQMEDADGNVMPEKVYYDLLKQGLL